MSRDLQQYNFNYDLVDDQTASNLKKLENEWSKNISDFAYNQGKILKEGQKELAGSNQYDGYFQKWYEAMGVAKSTAYRLMNYYELVVSHWDKQERIKQLPKKLVYKISQKSADEELKQKVLDGNIDTYQEYQEAAADKESEFNYTQLDDDTVRSLEESTARITAAQKNMQEGLENIFEEIERTAEETNQDLDDLLKAADLYEVYYDRSMDNILDYAIRWFLDDQE